MQIMKKVFVLFILLFLFSCARGKIEPPKKNLTFKIYFAGSIDTTKAVYFLAFNTLPTSASGPYINNNTINIATTNYYVKLSGNSFSFVKITIDQDGNPVMESQPITNANFSGSSISINLEPTLLGDPTSFKANVFSFSIDSDGNLQPKDAFGDFNNDTSILHFVLSGEGSQSSATLSDIYDNVELTQEEGYLDLKNIYVSVVTLE
jgi:hypothetical protein